MTATLKRAIKYYSAESLPVVLLKGTEVEVCVEDGTACHCGDHFDLAPNEYDLVVSSITGIHSLTISLH